MRLMNFIQTLKDSEASIMIPNNYKTKESDLSAQKDNKTESIS